MQRLVDSIKVVCSNLNVDFTDVVLKWVDIKTNEITFFINWRYVSHFDVAQLNEMLSDSKFSAKVGKPKASHAVEASAEDLPYSPSIVIQKSKFDNSNVENDMVNAK